MKFRALHLFCGVGGGALGFQMAREEWKGAVGTIETLAGIDVDPEACADFEAITGAPAVQMDLFSREQYRDFHGKEPPSGWREASPFDIWRAVGGKYPDILFTSPPCKGFSGLLPQKAAESRKYQALNGLTLRGIRLALEAFEEDPPALVLLENVPLITKRGKGLLQEIVGLLQRKGYAIHEGYHDCGEIGGWGRFDGGISSSQGTNGRFRRLFIIHQRKGCDRLARCFRCFRYPVIRRVDRCTDCLDCSGKPGSGWP